MADDFPSIAVRLEHVATKLEGTAEQLTQLRIDIKSDNAVVHDRIDRHNVRITNLENEAIERRSGHISVKMFLGYTFVFFNAVATLWVLYMQVKS